MSFLKQGCNLKTLLFGGHQATDDFVLHKTLGYQALTFQGNFANIYQWCSHVGKVIMWKTHGALVDQGFPCLNIFATTSWAMAVDFPMAIP